MSFKTKVAKGARVLVTRQGKTKEGQIVDAERDFLKIEFRTYFLRAKTEWLRANDPAVKITFTPL